VLKGWLVYLVSVTLGLAVVGALLGAFVLALLWPTLPSLEALTDYQPKIPLRIVSYEGELLGERHPDGRPVGVGVAMGALGSDAAIEAADVVLMTDEPSKLVSAIKIAKRTKQIVMQNIVFALGIKFIVLSLGAVGLASMWEAVFADMGGSLLVVFNGLRLLRK